MPSSTTSYAKSPATKVPIQGSQARVWAGRVFAVAAFIEAATWLGLLFGMYLKYIAQTTEVGVQVFGTLHGYAFIAYVVVTITAAVMMRWRWGTITLALIAAIPPFMTVPLEIWMRRSGRLRPRASQEAPTIIEDQPL